MEMLRKYHKIGDIIDVQVIKDFNYKIDIQKPRAIVLISVPESKVKACMRPPLSKRIEFSNSVLNASQEEGFYFGMMKIEGKKSLLSKLQQ
jgi:hypothetical protein